MAVCGEESGEWIEGEEGSTSKTAKSRLCILELVTYVLILVMNPTKALPQPLLESQRKFITE